MVQKKSTLENARNFYEIAKDLEDKRKDYEGAEEQLKKSLRLIGEITNGREEGNEISALELEEKIYDFREKIARERGDDRLAEKYSINQANVKWEISNKRRKFWSGITSIIIGLFVISPIITGNAIANISSKTSSVVGAAIILLGLYFLKFK